MELDVHDRPGEHAHARVLLRHALERREELELLHEIGRVARPSLGHRAAAEHADPVCAVDGRHLPYARSLLIVRKPVLYMVADCAVMHHVIQLDRTVVPDAEMLLGCGWFAR